jgi:hypothetical protein
MQASFGKEVLEAVNGILKTIPKSERNSAFNH